MVRFVTLIVFLVFSLAPIGTCFSAQSTADVPASTDLKGSARTEILGERAAQSGGEDEYVIGHGDILSVSVYGEGDMAATSMVSEGRPDQPGAESPEGVSGVRVMMDGRISLKHIGDVEVVGMTLTELADYLKTIYATIYEDPIVTTTLVQSNSLRYTVMGNVKQPGIFHLDYPVTIVQTIARSGGFNEWANQEITVVRKELKPGDERVFSGNTLKFDYDDFISGAKIEKNILVRSGDTLIVH